MQIDRYAQMLVCPNYGYVSRIFAFFSRLVSSRGVRFQSFKGRIQKILKAEAGTLASNINTSYFTANKCT